MKPRLVLARVMTDAVMERIQTEFDAVLPPQAGLSLDEIVAAAERHGALAVLVTAATKLDAAAIARLPESVRVIATCSVGYDHIDLPAARAHGLIVTNTPDVLNAATADLTMMLMLCAARRGSEYATIMREGWRRSFGTAEMLGHDLGGKTLGIYGMGRIGRAVARRARAFDMKVIYHNRSRLPSEREEGADYVADFHEMLPRAQVLSLHAPGGMGTARVMNREAFALLPRGAIFVNTSRGSLVDEDALYDALTSGQLFAAGLDVFAQEPAYDLRFSQLPNVFLTPHVASATVETRSAMGNRALDNIADIAAGRPARDALV
ncbi:2-hydroxyacid dehydrogenase [Roseomonas xinghualingensis]|uniref:2-hydroxyacid dehydrogenase n=1 Tax=Roseomonas xinghualingensis TaxID=2986475 RepID=UPI0021F0BAA9|nr:D-glycerate dehydrogenase [Roseomonas sp. SXEYE001]MCV4206501.1 D-glycerate dehydrogenase [Roseomonas sp. SXEYE001]